MKLGVNIDHIATLRQARLETFPDPVEAAKEAIAGGADGIVCHLREDRRHIQDKDVFRLRKLKTRLDLEMAATPEMVKFAIKLKPEMVTLVPEKRREVTTEGGLDIVRNAKKLGPAIEKMKKAGVTFLAVSEREVTDLDRLSYDMMDFIFDGFIILSRIRKGSYFERVLTVAKIKGQDHSLDVYPVAIGAEGLKVLFDQTPFSLVEKEEGAFK